jgi:hypothetical protein
MTQTFYAENGTQFYIVTAATVTHLQGLLTCVSAFVSFVTVFPPHGEHPLQNYQSETTIPPSSLVETNARRKFLVLNAV